MPGSGQFERRSRRRTPAATIATPLVPAVRGPRRPTRRLQPPMELRAERHRAHAERQEPGGHESGRRRVGRREAADVLVRGRVGGFAPGRRDPREREGGGSDDTARGQQASRSSHVRHRSQARSWEDHRMLGRDVMMRSIARAATFGWFRSVETSGVERVPRRGPALIVANHDGGFVDPVLLAAALPRFPRFLAMASLWRTARTTVPGARRGGPRASKLATGAPAATSMRSRPVTRRSAPGAWWRSSPRAERATRSACCP